MVNLQNSSLKIIQDAITEVVTTSNIPLDDKVELMLNLNLFLEAKNYEDNIKILEKRRRLNEQKNIHTRNYWN